MGREGADLWQPRQCAAPPHPSAARWRVCRTATTPRVGKTPGRCASAGIRWNDPHVRGEGGDYILGSREELGRPPPGWGRLVQGPRMGDHRRLTPTRVGKTLSSSPARTTRRTDPHVCGEDGTGKTTLAEAADRPPRVRGELTPRHALHGQTEQRPRVWGRRLPRRHHDPEGRTPILVGKAAYGPAGCPARPTPTRVGKCRSLSGP